MVTGLSETMGRECFSRASRRPGEDDNDFFKINCIGGFQIPDFFLMLVRDIQ